MTVDYAFVFSFRSFNHTTLEKNGISSKKHFFVAFVKTMFGTFEATSTVAGYLCVLIENTLANLSIQLK